MLTKCRVLAKRLFLLFQILAAKQQGPAATINSEAICTISGQFATDVPKRPLIGDAVLKAIVLKNCNPCIYNKYLGQYCKYIQ